MPVDDRVEVPEGFRAGRRRVGTKHPVLAGIRGPWPYLLGFNEVAPKPDATVLLKTSSGDDALPLLVVGTHGAGRTMAWTSDIGPHWLPETFSAWKGYGRLLAAGVCVALAGTVTLASTSPSPAVSPLMM